MDNVSYNIFRLKHTTVFSIKIIIEIIIISSAQNVATLGTKQNEMGGACGAYGGGEKGAQGSGGET